MTTLQLEEISKEVKQIIEAYDSEAFMSEMALLLTYIKDGPIPFQPFDKLHSPMRQIFYMAALNVCSSKTEREEYDVYRNDAQWHAWRKIIYLLFKIDQAYEEKFIDVQRMENPEDLEKMKIAYPSFLNYFYTGPLNYEEQVIERIERYFSPFDSEIKTHFGLTIEDFIKIYNVIDEQLHLQLNRIFRLLEIPECKEFWERMGKEKIRPRKWETTDNSDVNKLIFLMQNGSEKLKIALTDLYDKYDRDKIDSFIAHLSCNSRINDNFLFYTESNPLFTYPIFSLKNERILVFQIKQIIHGVYNILFQFCTRNGKSAERFYKIRGFELEKKVEEILSDYFGKKALIIRDYKTKLGKGQDVLLWHKDMVLIIEAKASKKDEPAENINKAFSQVKSNFKDILQKGYEQANRVEELFYSDEIVELFNKDMKKIHEIPARNIRYVFSIIVTLEKFAEIQTDLDLMLELNEDSTYPYSICIDDLEVLLLVMKKRKFSHADFIRFFNQRELFHGRLMCKDELELCGEFFYYKKFNMPPDDGQPIVTRIQGTDIFEEYYEKGMGFKNEKNIERKTSGRFMNWPPSNKFS